jgi:ribosomal protein S18 acetylase RimI-like enzyme
MEYVVREAAAADTDAMLRLLPRLAAFELPPGRTAEELWHGDAELLRGWLAGEQPHCVALVATRADGDGAILGLTLSTLRPEILSGRPSAHLEVLAVADEAEGHGVGRALMQATERMLRERGALTVSLHVFARNTRARRLYERMGYSGELIRYTKPL